MRYARVTVGDKRLSVDAAAFARLQDQYPQTDLHAVCIECGKPAFLNDKKGARGIRLVNLEVTRRGQKQRMVGFSHRSGNDGRACSLYFANDPRFHILREKNHFDILEKERNRAALAKPFAREAVSEVQRYFMHILTGNSRISPDDKRELVRIEKQVINMAGLADHLWILGYIGPLMIGSRGRMIGTKRPRMQRVEFRGVGHQELSYVGLDGDSRRITLPAWIDLSYSRADGRPPNRTLGAKNPASFPVSRDKAVAIFQKSYAQARDAQARAELEHWTRAGQNMAAKFLSVWAAPAPVVAYDLPAAAPKTVSEMAQKVAEYERRRRPFRRPQPLTPAKHPAAGADNGQAAFNFGGGKQ